MTHKGQMNLDYFIFEWHLEPIGLLPVIHAKAASAAWYFAKCANLALARVPEQVSLEGTADQTVNLRQIADSIATQYQLSLEDFMRFIPLCEREAARCGLGWDSRLTAWWESGGRAWDTVTREEGRLNIQ